jgi:hypothetical protein
MDDIFKRTPLARVLIIAPTSERIALAERYWRGILPDGELCVLGGTARPQLAQIIIGTCDVVRREIRYVGAIDLVIADDCLNMAQFIGSRRYTEILETLRRRNRAVDIREYPSTKLFSDLTDADFLVGWHCGTDLLAFKHPSNDIHVYEVSNQPVCGFLNSSNHFFCRNCGRFRGFQ